MKDIIITDTLIKIDELNIEIGRRVIKRIAQKELRLSSFNFTSISNIYYVSQVLLKFFEKLNKINTIVAIALIIFCSRNIIRMLKEIKIFFLKN